MKSNLLFIVLLALGLMAHTQNSSQFSKQEVLSDLSTLKTSLEETHCNAFAYTSKEEFENTYQRLKQKVTKDSLSSLEVINLYQQLISVLNNGHTEIPFPGTDYGSYAYNGGTLFPLELAFEDGTALVRKNFSDTKEIEIGSEIISINNRSIEDVLKDLAPHISAERPYFKLTKIELYSFPRLYWQVFGKQDTFNVGIKKDGHISTYSIAAVDLIEGYETKRNEVFNAHMQLKFMGNSAYLNPGHLSGDLPLYKKFIDSSFAAINEHQSKRLIIDLRNNLGGDDPFGDYLVSYIADQPFQWASSLKIKSSRLLKEDARKNRDTKSPYWSAVLAHNDGELFDYEFQIQQPQDEAKRFKGSVYVLVNRQSHSQSAVTAAQIQDYGFATIVGEETGDYASLYASQFTFWLPKTGIEVKTAKGFITRVNGNVKAQGVIPDIIIRDHLLDEDDEILEQVLLLQTSN